MSIRVRLCVKDIGVIFLSIHEDNVMPIAMAGSTITKPTLALMTLPQDIPLNACIIFSMAGLSILNPIPISIAVSDCFIPIGVIALIIQEDAVSAIAINTMAAEVTAASLRVILSAAILAKAFDNMSMAKDRPITEKKFIPPTNLNAIPIARTATAMRSIVPTPFLMSLSFFLSPPALSNSLFLSLDLFLERDIIVS